MTKERLCSLIFTGVAIAALGVAGYAVYLGEAPLSAPPPVLSNHKTSIPFPGADPTADWKTYRNEEYGFEVKYPAEARIFGDFNKDKQFSIFPYEVTEGTGVSVALREQSVAAIRAEIIADYPNRIDLDRETLFNGYNAREIVYRSEVGGPYKVILIPNATNKTFLLRQPTDLHLGDAILSTFRFIE
ncbi:MAG: hypothetical protein Q8R13_03595 [bacterium]|nr:hypothetical protein [bacterium]MDZ4296436.1 hypothetical protein [Patescibacteria group bacterium]